MILAVACTTEEQPVIPKEPDTRGNGTEEVTLRLAFPGENSTDTRAFSVEDEYKIDSLRIFVFKDGGTGNRLNDLYMYTVATTPGAVTGAGQIKTATVKFKSTPEKQRIMVVANMPDGLFTTLTLTEGTTTARSLLEQLTFNGAPWQKNVGTGDKALPMFGQLTDFYDVGAGTLANPYPNPVEISMIRSVAKVEIGVDVNNGTGDPPLGFGAYFKIHTVYVCNASNQGYIAPDSSLLKASLNPSAITKPNYYPGPGGTLPARKDSIKYSFPDVVPHVVPLLERTIYIPESDTFSIYNVNNPDPDLLKRTETFLIVKATYYGDTAFYRLDFVKDNQYAHILRNHSYKFNITGLRKMGYATLDEAYTAPSLTTLNPHLELDNADAEIKEIVYNKDYFLGVSTTTLHINWHNAAGFHVKTSYQGGLDATITNSGGFLTGSVHPDSHIDAGPLFHLSIICEENHTGQPRIGEITVKAGELEQKITVIQSPGTYSYFMLSSAPTGSFPVSSAWIDGSDATTRPLINGTLSVLYGSSVTGTSPTIISTNNQIVNYNITGTGPSIIGLKNPSGKVVWSWLVWVLPSAYTTIPTHSYNGYEFMDFDLGCNFSGTAQSGQGPFFQWGRKDALFPDNSPFNKAEAYALGSLDSTIAHPLTFYYNPSMPFDWKRDWQNNNLWIGANGEKTAYDPCPFGWRVPPALNNAESPWSGFSNGDNGLHFNESAGFDGISGSPTSNGFVWSASSRNSNAYGFRGSPLGAQNLNRANGHAVRCVRDNIRRIK
ncbi:hypothetical protein FACS1894181_08290 [Bacteroidia bacterium]|nr:hypothetical protein FACS1894181_08290 [Bacteroidia bacterium]